MNDLREAIRDHGTYSEEQAVTRLLHSLELTGGARHRAVAVAMSLVEGARARRDERPFLDAFLQEFGLSNQEGIALMCIAEALLRIPDDATADRLIAEKLATGDWSAHSGQSESLFVNASTWGLMLTGGILELDPAIKTDATGWMRKLTRKAGEPAGAPRGAPGDAHHRRRIRGRPQHRRGAGAQRPRSGSGPVLLRHAGRRRAHAAGRRALPGILPTCHRCHRRRSGRGREPHEASSISIKLSALEPRYSLLQRERVMQRLVPQVLALARRAAGSAFSSPSMPKRRIGWICRWTSSRPWRKDPATQDWPGLGLAVQAYGKRALDVIDWVAATLANYGRRMTRAPGEGCVLGFGNQARAGARSRRVSRSTRAKSPPMYRTWPAPAACSSHADVIYSQFATHNAHSIASVLELAPAAANFEFQRLHGMGRLLYAEAAAQGCELSAGAGLCAGGRAQGSAGLSGAAAAREWRQHLVRESLHG